MILCRGLRGVRGVVWIVERARDESNGVLLDRVDLLEMFPERRR